MIIINRKENDWCQHCKYVDFYDWYICNNKNVSENLFDKHGFINDVNTWEKCNCFEKHEN